MPTVLRASGYRVFFTAHDRSEPPHVHVVRADGHAKVWLDPIELAWARGLRSDQVTELLELVDNRRVLLLEAWHDYFAR